MTTAQLLVLACWIAALVAIPAVTWRAQKAKKREEDRRRYQAYLRVLGEEQERKGQR